MTTTVFPAASFRAATVRQWCARRYDPHLPGPFRFTIAIFHPCTVPFLRGPSLKGTPPLPCGAGVYKLWWGKSGRRDNTSAIRDRKGAKKLRTAEVRSAVRPSLPYGGGSLSTISDRKVCEDLCPRGHKSEARSRQQHRRASHALDTEIAGPCILGRAS